MDDSLINLDQIIKTKYDKFIKLQKVTIEKYGNYLILIDLDKKLFVKKILLRFQVVIYWMNSKQMIDKNFIYHVNISVTSAKFSTLAKKYYVDHFIPSKNENQPTSFLESVKGMMKGVGAV